jgi:hypothetical protein
LFFFLLLFGWLGLGVVWVGYEGGVGGSNPCKAGYVRTLFNILYGIQIRYV